MEERKKIALLVGASGLVGIELLNILLSAKEYEKVVAFVRRPLGIEHLKYEERIVNFDNLELYREDFKVQDVFCCLGTTIKKAKSREAFKKVDVDYPLKCGQLAKEMQVAKFLIISSTGADSNSRVFYSRMKGVVEKELINLQLNSLHIFRPSLLLGSRQEFRLGESIGAFLAKTLSFAFNGPLKGYKPIAGKHVAFAMYKTAQRQIKGVYFYSSEEISKVKA